LVAYLQALCDLPYSGHLLVGEAPGHRGCALTGVPFTSQRILTVSEHPFIVGIRPSLDVTGDVTESTATMVWSHFAERPAVPAFWNVFPFHPHTVDDQKSNRKPTRAETEAGRPFLELILEILTPHTIIAVGNTAATTIGRVFPELELVIVPHPSYGNKAAFVAGLTAAGL
jgi:hypothetical protein